MPKDWQKVEVTADKLAQIEESYSGDTIADSKSVRRPFKFNGKFYVSTGGVCRGPTVLEEEAYQIVPRGEFEGKACFYGEPLRQVGEDEEGEDWAAQRRAQREGFYHGMLINRGKSEWVLVGPPLLFVAKEGSIGSKQLSLL